MNLKTWLAAVQNDVEASPLIRQMAETALRNLEAVSKPEAAPVAEPMSSFPFGKGSEMLCAKHLIERRLISVGLALCECGRVVESVGAHLRCSTCRSDRSESTYNLVRDLTATVRNLVDQAGMPRGSVGEVYRGDAWLEQFSRNTVAKKVCAHVNHPVYVEVKTGKCRECGEVIVPPRDTDEFDPEYVHALPQTTK